MLYELLLKRGIELTTTIEMKNAANKTIYSIGYGGLFGCLDTSIDGDEVDEVAQGIIDWHKELDPETDTHVFSETVPLPMTLQRQTWPPF